MKYIWLSFLCNKFTSGLINFISGFINPVGVEAHQFFKIVNEVVDSNGDNVNSRWKQSFVSAAAKYFG